jgi:UDPglucose 6-dehydrogenase
MRVAVIGLGYVGLVTSAGFAEWGHDVTGVESDPVRLSALRTGVVPFHEPGLARLVAAHTESGRLRFAASADEAVPSADIVFIAVGTHDGSGGWQTDTMDSCLRAVAPLLGSDGVIVIRSTLPPAYVKRLATLIGNARGDRGTDAISVLLNTEFTREGQAIHDFLSPDRVVIGVATDRQQAGAARLAEAYRRARAPILTMTAVDACFAKLGANLFLATKISFANELATLCEAHDADITRVVSAMAFDRRIGGQFLRAGVGFGGSCLPHQVAMAARGLVADSVPTPLMRAVWSVNNDQRERYVERLTGLVGGSLSGQRVALLGLAFKPETDDLRESPALAIAELLIEAGAAVIAYDPMAAARERASSLVAGLQVAASAMEAIAGSDAVALVTEWPEFVDLDWRAAADLMTYPRVLDGRNVLDAAMLVHAGFAYAGIARRVSLDEEPPAQVTMPTDVPLEVAFAIDEPGQSADVNGGGLATYGIVHST